MARSRLVSEILGGITWIETNLRHFPAGEPAGSGKDRVASSMNRPAFDLSNRRTAVLGSTSGIGRAVALALAEAGADVIVHGRSSRDAAEEVATAVRERGGRSAVLMADLADREAGDRLVEE